MRTISIILVHTFLLSDLTWAAPDIFTSKHSLARYTAMRDQQVRIEMMAKAYRDAGRVHPVEPGTDYHDRLQKHQVASLPIPAGGYVVKPETMNDDHAFVEALKLSTPGLERGEVEVDGVSQPTLAARLNSEFRNRFEKLSEGIYPQHLLRRMQQDGYDPIIVGYDDYAGLAALPRTQKIFEAIRDANPGQTIKVALEIVPPKQLEYIKIFVRDEQEYKKSGTIGGKTPSSSTVNNLLAYRDKIRRNSHHSENLALWLLDNGFAVIPIEHSDIESWIRQDGYMEEEEETFGHVLPSLRRPAFTAIRRDIHGLGVIDREGPHVIAVGSAHALKYDFLLERDGSRSFYCFVEPLNWSKLLNLWEEVHLVYRSQAKSTSETNEGTQIVPELRETTRRQPPPKEPLQMLTGDDGTDEEMQPVYERNLRKPPEDAQRARGEFRAFIYDFKGEYRSIENSLKRDLGCKVERVVGFIDYYADGSIRHGRKQTGEEIGDVTSANWTRLLRLLEEVDYDVDFILIHIGTEEIIDSIVETITKIKKRNPEALIVVSSPEAYPGIISLAGQGNISFTRDIDFSAEQTIKMAKHHYAEWSDRDVSKPDTPPSSFGSHTLGAAEMPKDAQEPPAPKPSEGAAQDKTSHEKEIPPVSEKDVIANFNAFDNEEGFIATSDNCTVERILTGHINITYCLTNRTTGKKYIVQKLNTIFDINAIDHNIGLLEEAQSKTQGKLLPTYWNKVSYLNVRGATPHKVFYDEFNRPWRVMNFITGDIKIFSSFSEVPEIDRVDVARSLGEAIATFGRILGSVPPDRWRMTLPNFHNARYHMQYFKDVYNGKRDIRLSLSQDPMRIVNRSLRMMETYRERIEVLRSKVEEREYLATCLDGLGAAVAHSDTKINNFVFIRDKSGKMRCVGLIDLDTLQAGNPLDDLGDGLRSAGNPAGEEPADINDVRIDTVIIKNIIAGYLERVKELYGGERATGLAEHAIDAFKLYFYMLCLRFFADALVGNEYWKLKPGMPEDINLYRAEVQMRALQELEKVESQLKQEILSAVQNPAAPKPDESATPTEVEQKGPSSTDRVRKRWHDELGIDEVALARAIMKFPSLASRSITNNIVPKANLLSTLGIKKEEMIDSLIGLAVYNVKILQLIVEVLNQMHLKIKDVEELKRIYRRFDRVIRRKTGISAAKWIKQKEQENTIEEARSILTNILTGIETRGSAQLPQLPPKEPLQMVTGVPPIDDSMQPVFKRNLEKADKDAQRASNAPEDRIKSRLIKEIKRIINLLERGELKEDAEIGLNQHKYWSVSHPDEFNYLAEETIALANLFTRSVFEVIDLLRRRKIDFYSLPTVDKYRLELALLEGRNLDSVLSQIDDSIIQDATILEPPQAITEIQNPAAPAGEGVSIETLFSRLNPKTPELFSSIVEKFNLKGKRGIEIGTGTCVVECLSLLSAGMEEMTMLDNKSLPDPKEVKGARIKLVKADARQLPFDDNSFDLAYFDDSLTAIALDNKLFTLDSIGNGSSWFKTGPPEELKDGIVLPLSEAYRILKPAGHLLVLIEATNPKSNETQVEITRDSLESQGFAITLLTTNASHSTLIIAQKPPAPEPSESAAQVQEALNELNEEVRKISELNTHVSGLNGVCQRPVEATKLYLCVPIGVLKNSADMALALQSIDQLIRRTGRANTPFEKIPFELVVTGVKDKEDFDAVNNLKNNEEVKKTLNLPKNFTVRIIEEKEIQGTVGEYPRNGYDASTPQGRATIIKEMHVGTLKEGEYMAIVTDAVSESEAEEVEKELSERGLNDKHISIRILTRPEEKGRIMFSLSAIIKGWLEDIQEDQTSVIRRVLGAVISYSKELDQKLRAAWRILASA